MKNKLIYCIILLFTVLNCGDKLAGGSGAGNPGATTVAIISVTTDSAGIPDTLTEDHPGVIMFPDTLRIYDDSSERFTVVSAEIHIRRIVFLFDSTEKKSPAIDSVQLPLTTADDGIILQGPFVFNVLTGLSEPPLPGFTLPVGKYRGIRIDYDSLSPAIKLKSQFHWNDNLLQLIVAARLTGGDLFKNDGNSFNVHKNMRITISIVLNASKWLKGLSIVSSLNNKELTVNQDGIVSLESKDTGSRSAAMAGLIVDNLRKSGKLLINHANITDGNQDE